MGFKKKDMIQVDQETGEILPGVTILIPDKSKLKDPFMLASREGFIRLAKDKDLTGEDRRVLDVYLASMDFENWIHISQQEIADLLEMPKQNVSRSTKRLVDKTILIEGPKLGRSKTFRLNVFYGWKGRINKEYYDTYEQHTTLMQAVD